jgi:hypothetical protein
MGAFSAFARLRPALLGCLTLLLPACVEPYQPAILNAPPSYLVVDGFINGDGITTIHLSRTYEVGARTSAPQESKATLFLEAEAGPRFALRETSKGTYASDKLTLEPGKRYRLRISTLPGQQYVSDFVPNLATPPLDSVSWRGADELVTIRVDTHDPKNATRYYRWEYEETWEIKPLLVADQEYVRSSRTIRYVWMPYPMLCWRTANSADLKLANTTKLTQDVVDNFTLLTIPSTSDRLFRKYSILVKQYALSKEEYAYWDLLRKNTENIGTLFDPLPSQLSGNVHCTTDEAQPVLGYVGAHTVQQRRIFISRDDIPRAWRYKTGYESCYPPDTIIKSQAITTFNSGLFVPVTELAGSYTFSTPDCVDCRLRGSAVKPDFWP